MKFKFKKLTPYATFAYVSVAEMITMTYAYFTDNLSGIICSGIIAIVSTIYAVAHK